MNCYICEQNLVTQVRLDNSTNVRVRCPRCGEYIITETAIASARSIRVSRSLMSAGIRYASDRGRIVTFEVYGTSNEEEITSLFPRTNDPLDLVDLLLDGIVRIKSQYVTKRDIVFSHEVSLIGTDEESELQDILVLAKQMGYIRFYSNSYSKIEILPDGWKRIREIRTIHPDGNLAFVAMHFSEDMKGVYSRVFEPVLLSNGYIVAPTINPMHNGKIDDFIIGQIRKSSLMIADFTDDRNNVYYEAGFAVGLNIEVIRCVKYKEGLALPFDTRQYNHIEWKDEADLNEKLTNRIQSLPARK